MTMINIKQRALLFSGNYASIKDAVAAAASVKRLVGADLSGTDLSGLSLVGADLSGADFSAAVLNGVDMTGANLSNADLHDASFDNDTLFVGANLTGAYFGDFVPDPNDPRFSGANVDAICPADPPPDQVLAPATFDPPGLLQVKVTGPHEPDGKQVVVVSPATEGFKTWITSRGDGATAADRGLGQRILVEFDGTESVPATKYVDFGFIEPLEVHDGQLNWYAPDNFEAEDEFSVSVRLPASVATSTPGTGNVNEVALGGGAVLYVPATLNDGSHTIDLTDFTEAVPVPADGAGYWDVDYQTGAIAASATPGAAAMHLVNFPNEAFLIASVSMANTIGLFDIDVYKTEWVHPAWKIRLSVTKTVASEGKVSGWLLCFRRKPTRG